MTAMPWGQKNRTSEIIQSQMVTPPLAAIEGTTFRLKTATTKRRTRSRRPRARIRWGWAGWAVVDKAKPKQQVPHPGFARVRNDKLCFYCLFFTSTRGSRGRLTLFLLLRGGRGHPPLHALSELPQPVRRVLAALLLAMRLCRRRQIDAG